MPFDVTGRPAKELVSHANGGTINMLMGTPASGLAIPVGPQGDYRIGFDLTITSCTVLCTDPDAGGNLVVDILATTFGAFAPPTHPVTPGDSICGASKPTLSAAQKSDDATLSGWTVDLNTGTVLRPYVVSGDVVAASVILFVTRR